MLIVLIKKEIKYTKAAPLLPGSGPRAPASRQAQGNPGLDSPAGGDWTQERTDRNLDQERRQEKGQGPLQKPAMDEESKALVIPQL